MDEHNSIFMPVADRRAIWARLKEVTGRDSRILAGAKAHHAAEHELVADPQSWFRCDRKLQHLGVAYLVLKAADKVDPLRRQAPTPAEREARRDAFARMICSSQ